MPGPANLSFGNIANSFFLQLTVVAGAALTASTTTTRTYTLLGVRLGDIAWVNKPSATAGVSIAGVRVSAADTIEISFGNLTAGTPSLPASEVYLVRVDRPGYDSPLQIPTGIA